MMNRLLMQIPPLLGMVCMIGGGLMAQQPINVNFDRANTLVETIGRGQSQVANGVYSAKDAYAVFGDKSLQNYRMTFRARNPKPADQVQIWAGFRTYNRFDRYIVGLKGGLQNDLYLSRMGYMAADELLGLAPLDFKPQVGQWYQFRIEVCGNRIRVFLNDESLPRIDVIDPNSNLAPSGQVALGGGWIETEYDQLFIEPLAANALEGVSNQVYSVQVSAEEKEIKRVEDRASYQMKSVAKLAHARTEISLDGNWLFMPEYLLKDSRQGADPSQGDQHWHLMHVPDFWNPIRIWLHGETMNNNKFPKGVSDAYYQQETKRCEEYTFDYKKTKAAWYRQWIDLPADIQQRNSELIFDAVSKMADVYVNGKLVTSHVGMFGEIKSNVSTLLKPGKNLISVHVTKDYIKDIADADKVVDVAVTVPVTNKMLKDIAHGFYVDDPAGIWQPVKLVITDKVRVEDVFIQPSLTGARFDVTVKNYSNKQAVFSLSTHIAEADAGRQLVQQNALDEVKLNPGEERVLTYAIDQLQPKLWSPEHPNLYDFKIAIRKNKTETQDQVTVRSGFRTFESKNGLLYLNGKPYWLRGGNHTPFALAPNDSVLANRFYQLMKAGNMEITRTHTTPYNKLWIDAADKNGIGISHEGTWPWLMIQSSMPEMKLIEMWAEEYLSLLKKYRNHPAILFWTINNEMKFYDNEPDMEKRKLKMKIISDVVKRMRKIDPSRPICFDSNYRRREDVFGKDFFATIDDGDIDDIHAYINWYDHSVFKQFKGEFQRDNRNEGRPLISQEMSTGYPNNETGHPTRSYTLQHQNPQSLIGYQSYAYANPASFLQVQSFITGELAEALRRSNDKASGVLHFALLTWFRNVYNSRTIEPYPTYYAMKRAMQPVLVSAELWGRHLFAGQQLQTKFCVVNDLEEGTPLGAGTIEWAMESSAGNVLAKGTVAVPAVGHYERQWVTPHIVIPEQVPFGKQQVSLKIRYRVNEKIYSSNVYELMVATKEWAAGNQAVKKMILVDPRTEQTALDVIKTAYKRMDNMQMALQANPEILILNETFKDFSVAAIDRLKQYIAQGGNVLLLNNEEAAKAIFPNYVKGWIKPTEGDIVNMEIPESSVFNDIDLLDLRYFNNHKAELPKVCHSAFQLNRHEKVIELASQIKIHGYIEGEMDERSKKMNSIKGYPIFQVNEGKGQVIVSSMAHEKTATDPIAAKLLVNMINTLAHKK